MKLYEFAEEYDNLTAERVRAAWIKIFAYLIQEDQDNETVLADILGTLEDYEENDYFGTEGLDV